MATPSLIAKRKVLNRKDNPMTRIGPTAIMLSGLIVEPQK
jgi:hypothetical protein